MLSACFTLKWIKIVKRKDCYHPLVASTVQAMVVTNIFFMKTTSPWTALGGFLFFKKKFIEYIGRRHHLINNIPSMDLDEVFISIFCDLY